MSEIVDHLSIVLDEYVQLAQRHGGFDVSRLRPGRTLMDLEAAAREADIVLPPEALALFAWHDGMEMRTLYDDTLMAQWRFVPFDDLLAWRQGIWSDTKRELDMAIYGAPQVDPWLEWFPLLLGTDEPSAIIIDCRTVSSGAPHQCTTWDMDARHLGDSPIQLSVISLLEMWSWFLRDDHMRWNHTGHGWLPNPVSPLHWSTLRMAFV